MYFVISHYCMLSVVILSMSKLSRLPNNFVTDLSENMLGVTVMLIIDN